MEVQPREVVLDEALRRRHGRARRARVERQRREPARGPHLHGGLRGHAPQQHPAPVVSDRTVQYSTVLYCIQYSTVLYV